MKSPFINLQVSPYADIKINNSDFEINSPFTELEEENNTIPLRESMLSDSTTGEEEMYDEEILSDESSDLSKMYVMNATLTGREKANGNRELEHQPGSPFSDRPADENENIAEEEDYQLSDFTDQQEYENDSNEELLGEEFDTAIYSEELNEQEFPAIYPAEAGKSPFALQAKKQWKRSGNDLRPEGWRGKVSRRVSTRPYPASIIIQHHRVAIM